MQNYLASLILIAVVIGLGLLYYGWSTGMFNGFTSSVAKNSNGVIQQTITFDIVSPPDGQSYTFQSATTTDNVTVYYATVAVEITGDGNILNGKYITVGTNTKGYYVVSTAPSNLSFAQITAQPYAKFKITDTTGDYTYTVYVVSDHPISTAGEQVTLQIKVGTSSPKPVNIYAYPAS